MNPLSKAERQPLVFVKLDLPEIAPNLDDIEWPALLREQHTFETHCMLMCFNPKHVRHEDDSHTFAKVQSPSGKYILELAIELPDLVPLAKGQSEAMYHTQVAGQLCPFFVSNRMSRMHFAHNGMSKHNLVPRYKSWVGTVIGEDRIGTPVHTVEQFSQTFVCMQFEISGESADEAVETNLALRVNMLLAAINTFIRSAWLVRSTEAPAPRAVTTATIQSCYLKVRGDDGSSAAQLSLNSHRAARVHPELDEGQASELVDLLEGRTKPDDVAHLLADAWGSYGAGDYRFALLQAVMVAEIATVRLVRQGSSRRDFGRKKLGWVKYAWALSIGLKLVVDRSLMPPSHLVHRMDQARDFRNKLMHENEFAVEDQELRQLLRDTEDFVKALSKVTAAWALDSQAADTDD